MFLLTLGFALLGAATRSAATGYVLAVAVLVFIGFLVTFFAACVGVFCIAWGLASLRTGYRQDGVQGSTFAEGQLPPQILPPRNPST